MTQSGRLLRMLVATWAACVVGVTAQAPESFVIDPAMSSVTLHVGRSGVFAFAGHDHEIVAPVSRGTITLDRLDVSRSSMSVQFDAAALRVTGKGEPPGDVPEVQRVMLSERVLDVQQYAVISFVSRTISVIQRSADRMSLRVAGDFTLHGVTRPLTVPVNLQLMTDGLRADGTAVVRQTEFGIRPVTAGAGTVRVRDEVDVRFSVAARRR